MPSLPILLALAIQIANAATVESILPGLIANGDRYAAALPSLTCDETVVSRLMKRDKVKEEVTIQGSIRVQRTGDERRPFEEQYHWLTRNGKPVEKDKSLKAPYFLYGAFANGLRFSNSGRIACFDITIEDQPATLILNLQRKQNISADPICADLAPHSARRVTVDRATGHVARLESSMTAEESEQRKQPFYVAIDYRPTNLGQETFWLPIHVETHTADDDRRLSATYVNCRRFTGSMKIVGTPEVVPQ